MKTKKDENKFHLSILPPIQARANAIIKARGMKGPSNLVEVLIREEFERRELKLEEESSCSESHVPADIQRTIVHKVKKLVQPTHQPGDHKSQKAQ